MVEKMSDGGQQETNKLHRKNINTSNPICLKAENPIRSVYDKKLDEKKINSAL